MEKKIDLKKIEYGRTIEFRDYNLVEVNLGDGYSARHYNLAKLDGRRVLLRSPEGDFTGVIDIPPYFQDGFALNGALGTEGPIYFSCKKIISVYERISKS